MKCNLQCIFFCIANNLHSFRLVDGWFCFAVIVEELSILSSALVSQHILVYYSNIFVESRTRSYPIWFLFCEASVGIRERNKLKSLFRKSLGDLVVFPVYLHTSHVSRDLLEEYSMRNLLS